MGHHVDAGHQQGRSILSFLKKLSLAQKLTGFAALCALPIVILGWSLISEKLSQLKALEKEREGLAYLQQTWPLLVDLYDRQLATGETTPLAAFELAAQSHDASILTAENSKQVLDSIKDGLASDIALPRAAQHIRLVADRSGLTLDRSLDLAYLVAALTQDLPRTVQSAFKAEAAIRALSKSMRLELDQKSSLLVAKNEAEIAVNQTLETITSSFASADDPKVSQALSRPIAGFTSSIEELNQALVKAANARNTFEISSDRASYERATASLVESADNLWRSTQAELARELGERYTILWRNLLLTLGAAAVLLGLSAIALYLTSRSIRVPIAALTSRMDRLRNGDPEFETPFVDHHNEIGDIARALEASRQNAIELSQARLEIDSRLGEETSRSADTSQFLEEIATVVSAARDGQLSQRLSQTGRTGFLSELSRSLNSLLSVIEAGISDTSKVINSLAEGEVNNRMEGSYKGVFAQLMKDVNKLGDQLRLIAGQIGGATAAVQGATREISTGIMDLSNRTEQQASSLEETAASMEELAATVRQNADNAQQANQLAADARQLAVGGGDIANRAVSAMDKIEQSSKQVSEIVGLIQEIAFQTNILALNAAVEAARAGEAGRGFAVVANEVRALAQRSAQASKDIKQLIAHTDGNVTEGVQLVQQAGASLTEITNSVRKVADIISEIAAASQEQSSGIDQVSKAITNMDEMTQQNAALVEETNAALHSAKSQIEQLRQAVSFFRTGLVLDAQAFPVAPELAKLPPASVPSNQPEPSLHDRLRQLAQKMASVTERQERPAVPLTFSKSDWKEF
jgi:methyl-accepting chemotaxis protein